MPIPFKLCMKLWHIYCADIMSKIMSPAFLFPSNRKWKTTWHRSYVFSLCAWNIGRRLGGQSTLLLKSGTLQLVYTREITCDYHENVCYLRWQHYDQLWCAWQSLLGAPIVVCCTHGHVFSQIWLDRWTIKWSWNAMQPPLTLCGQKVYRLSVVDLLKT
jgi:hypothetical protein